MFTRPSPVGNTVVDVSEDTPAGSTVYNMSGADQEGDTLVFTLDTGTDHFEIDGDQLKTIQPLDYETVTSYSIVVK